MVDRHLGVGGRKLAVTVVMVRDSPNGIEVYIQERVSSMPTYPNATVFPGGGVDPRDFEEPIGLIHRTYTGPSAQTWSEVLDVDVKKVRGLLFGAGRELFEETGTLLATHPDGSPIEDVSVYHEDRLALESHRLSLTQVLKQRELVLRGDLLYPFSRWVTADDDPHRFDAFSFLAVAPEGQEPDGNTREAASVGWFDPKIILDGWRAGLLRLVIPTWGQLWEVSQHDTVADLLEAFKEPDMTPIVGEPIEMEKYAEYYTFTPPTRF